MSESSGEELKSVDQAPVTNESIEEETSVVVVDEVQAKTDINALDTLPSTNIQMENSAEDNFSKETMQTLDSGKELMESVDQAPVTNESNEEENSVVTAADEVKAITDTAELDTHPPMDIQIEQDNFSKVTLQTMNSEKELMKSVDLAPVTNENCVVAAGELKASTDMESLDIQIENSAEKDNFSKQTLQMMDSDKELMKSVDLAEFTNANCVVDAGEVKASTDIESLDIQIEYSPEKDNFSKKTMQKIDSSNDENVDGDEICNAGSTTTKEETIAKGELSNTNPTALKDPEKEEKDISQDEHAEHVTYTGDGTAIYTDPKTNYQYKWCPKENNWVAADANTSAEAYENDHYKWCSATQKWIPKQTQVTETEHYKWDADKKQWVAKIKEATNTDQTNSAEIVYDIDEDGQRIYTDKDGMVFFWDVEKNAWFPKIDDDFMARYQMNYGFIDNTSESEREKEKRDLEAAVQKEKELAKMVEEAKASEEASKETTQQGLKRKQPQEPPKWFEINPEQNTKVYVSNLPLDITLDEFADVMGKCGMIMRDPQTQKYKLKLYTESDGQIKGDGLCDYIKVESVELALKILDEYDLRGHKMRVQRAQFQMRGEYNPALKPKRKKKDKEKLAKIKEKLFDWRPEKMRGERSKHEKTVIIKNLFTPELFEKEVQLILDYQNDLREECSKCGTVRKVVIYDRHSEGVAQVNMSSPEEGDLVIQMMHGRYFGQRKLTADHWDGKTKYKIEETEEETQKRLNKWDQYLESEENKKSDLKQTEKEDDNKTPKETETPTDDEVLQEIEDTSKLEESNT